MTTYGKMDTALKAEWVAALRSGKYRQGKERLVSLKNKRYSYCCLGVLCNLDTEIKRVPGGTPSIYAYMDGNASAEAYLPENFAQRIGLDFAAQDHLASMNDEGKSFAEIADWIEGHL